MLKSGKLERAALLAIPPTPLLLLLLMLRQKLLVLITVRLIQKLAGFTSLKSLWALSLFQFGGIKTVSG